MNKRKIRKGLKRISHLPANKNLPAYLANKFNHFLLKLSGSTRVAYPSTVMIELTNHCNLACTTCPREYRYGHEMDKGHMPLSRAKKIIDELWPYLDSVGLTGMGETFLYKEIAEIASYIRAKNKGIVISVSTNAVVPGFVEKAKKLTGMVDTIQISIDGLDDVYESIRHHARFSTLDKNISAIQSVFKDSETDIMLNMVVTQENYRHMPAMVSYAEKQKISYVNFTLFNLASVTDVDTSYYDFYNSPPFLEAVSELQKVSEKTRRVFVTPKHFLKGNSFRNCPFPWTHFYISWDGYIAPCCAKPFPKELHFGNVTDSKVIDILNSKSFREFRKMWKANKTPAFCKKCHFVDMQAV